MDLDCKSLAPTWEALASDFSSESGVLIAKVDAEAENSKATAQEQSVTSYPTIKFFPKGSTEHEPYVGGRSEKDFVDFINEKAGTYRTVGGGLNAKAGTIDVLDSIVAKFTGGAGIAEVAAEASKAASELAESAQHKYAQYYVKVFDKLSKSEKYVEKELARLDAMLHKGGMAPAKVDEFTSKTNILRRFQEKVAHVDEL